ncbi:DUF952 domain-containing protein [Paracoccus sp. (in: a-proteobacteria)]|uniref:DUF952 domain-containing protein n=1 Tax=Paracoccus sp. TaxID=267 RepID=UPI00396C3B72
MLIYKIFRPSEWAQLLNDGCTDGAPVDRANGYIHFSSASQVGATLAKHFAQEDRLMIVACEARSLSPQLLWEPSRGGALFPHLYRPLRIEDILWSRTIPLTAKGHDTGELE